MKNKGIVIFLIVLGVIIVALIAGDFLSTRPEKQPGNPYEYNVEQFKEVPAEMILYSETRNFRSRLDSLRGIAYCQGVLYLAGDKKIQAIDRSGKLIFETDLGKEAACIHVANGMIIAGTGNHISVLGMDGSLTSEWPPFDAQSVITSITSKNNLIFVADAGKRKVYRCNAMGEKLGAFEGKTGEGELHGFIVPSPCFDLAVNADGELWVVNPGNHSIENYTDEGVLRGFWKNSSMKIEGFSGCCNPAHIAFMPDGNIVTSEKGLVRIKIYKPSGEFRGVVAPTSKFTVGGHAPDLAVDEDGTVYALDADSKAIRVFEPVKAI